MRQCGGHPFGFQFEDKKIAYIEVVTLAKERSRAFIWRVLDELARMALPAVDTIPRRGDADQNWYEEYIQEDMLLNVVGTSARGQILLRALALLD
jgi:hypothetical protein